MRRFIPSLLASALCLAACDKKDEPAADPAVVAEAQKVWDTKCSTCHGKDGQGDGEAGKVLNPRPRNFHNSSWQGQTDDDRLRKVIVEGGGAVGLSTNMAPNPELADKPAVVNELIKRIRSYAP
jgi:cytochrome c5